MRKHILNWMAKTKKEIANTKCWWESGVTRTGNAKGYNDVGNSSAVVFFFCIKLNMHLLDDPDIILLGIYWSKLKINV